MVSLVNDIKKIKFRLSDLALLIFLVIGVFFIVEHIGIISSTEPDVTSLSQPFYLYILFSIILLTAGLIYLVLEYKNKSYQICIWVVVLLFLIVFSQLENIYLSPSYIRLNLLTIDNQPITAEAYYNHEIKFIHFVSMFYVLFLEFIGVFVFPKRINNIKTVSIIFYLLFIAEGTFFIYSLFKDDYISLFKVILGIEEATKLIKDMCPISIFGNPNTYGLFLEWCFFIAIANYTIDKKNINIIIAIFSYLLLVLTLCKAGILATSTALLIFIVMNIALSVLQKNKRRIIISSGFCLAYILLFSLLLIAAVAISNRNFYTDFLAEISSFTGRSGLWSVSKQLISGNYASGLGHGIYNSLITSASSFIEPTSTPITHNSFLALIGEGGMFFLIPYISLIIYSFVIVYKNKKDCVFIAIFASIISFMIHCMFEDSYYLVNGLICVLLVINNIKQQGNTIKLY